MATPHSRARPAPIAWNASRVRRLRGKRTQADFGELLDVPKNTVWRWESGRVTPDRENARRLTRLAEKECFLDAWKVGGSLPVQGDIEEAARGLDRAIRTALRRSARKLGE